MHGANAILPDDAANSPALAERKGAMGNFYPCFHLRPGALLQGGPTILTSKKYRSYTQPGVDSMFFSSFSRVSEARRP